MVDLTSDLVWRKALVSLLQYSMFEIESHTHGGRKCHDPELVNRLARLCGTVSLYLSPGAIPGEPVNPQVFDPSLCRHTIRRIIGDDTTGRRFTRDCLLGLLPPDTTIEGHPS